MPREASRPPARREAVYTSRLLLLAGGSLITLMIGIDWVKQSDVLLGPKQTAGLVLGLAAMAAGIALRRSRRVRRTIVRLWPFGSASPARPLEVLAFALWSGTLAALLEVGLRFLQYESGQRWGTLNPHAMWMTLVSNLILMLMISGVLVFFAVRGLRYLGSPRFILFVLLFVAVILPLSVYSTELSWISVGLLSAGLAFQGSTWIGAWRAIVRWSAVPLAIGVAIATLWPFAGQAWKERNALADLPPSLPEAPNVILIIWDTVRAQNMSLHGYARPTTPNLERLARRGTTYDRAIAPSSWTLPSHATMFTGRPPHRQSGPSLKPLDGGLSTLAESMRDHGYYTLGVIANYHNVFPHTTLDRGFIRYDAGTATHWVFLYVSSSGNLLRWAVNRLGLYRELPTRKDARVITDRFFDLAERRGERPFFAFLNYFDAHYPFDGLAPDELLDREWTDAATPIPPSVDKRKWQALYDYDRRIAYLDDQLGVLVEGLEQRGWMDDTIVIVTSDHGEEFGEHGKSGHGWNLYNPALLIPLLIYVPGDARAGTRVAVPVGLQDVPRTVVELAGIAESAPFDGRNLLTFAEDDSTGSRPILSELAWPERSEQWTWRSLVWANLHYIRNPDGSEEIYDLDEDPWETRNLFRTPRGHAALDRFRPALSSLIEDEPGPALTSVPKYSVPK